MILEARSYHPDIRGLRGPFTVRWASSHAWGLVDREGWVLTVTTAPYNGPLAVRLSLPSLHALDVQPGMEGRLLDDTLAIGRVGIRLTEATPWPIERDARLYPLSRPYLAAHVKQLHGEDPAGDIPALAQTLASALLALDVAAVSRQTLALLGRGPGLTPAGDDLLCGLLTGFHVLGSRVADGGWMHARAALLGEAVEAGVGGRTTALSRTMLRYAGRALAIEPLLDVLWSLGAGESVIGVPELLAVGHSSGRDLLAGALVAATVMDGGELGSALRRQA